MNIQIIKDLCAANHITLAELERNLGFSHGAIGKWKHSSPSLDKIIMVAKYFDVSVDSLCNYNSSQDKTLTSLQRFKIQHPTKSDSIDKLIQNAIKLLEDE